MDRCPEVRVMTVGVRLNLDASRYTHHRYIPLHELFYTVRKFDIGLAPIADIPMSYARSDIKVKEYAAAGVPWVASARGSYAALGPKAGGILVEDDGWEEALVTLVRSSFRRSRLQRQATKWGKSQHIMHHIGLWESAWKKAIEIAAETPAPAGRRTMAMR
jgi:glycosyltransferase involved in cell wall biosynthesis